VTGHNSFVLTPQKSLSFFKNQAEETGMNTKSGGAHGNGDAQSHDNCTPSHDNDTQSHEKGAHNGTHSQASYQDDITTCEDSLPDPSHDDEGGTPASQDQKEVITNGHNSEPAVAAAVAVVKKVQELTSAEKLASFAFKS
jgi:hypothetical protein